MKSQSKKLSKRPNPVPKKILEIVPETKSPNPPLLMKYLWMEIVDYLDIKSYFHIIPQVNSFFYFLIKDYKNHRTSLNFSLNVYCLKHNYNKDKDSMKIKPNKHTEYITECRKLKKLYLNLKLTEKRNKLKTIHNFSLSIFFVSLTSLSTIKILRITFIKNIVSDLQGFLKLLVNLVVLKLDFYQTSCNQNFSLSKYFKDRSYSITLKKISLKIYYYDSMQKEILNMFEFLDDKIHLDKISINYNHEYYELTVMPINLKPNCRLKCLKIFSLLDNRIAKDLCSFLANTEILEEFQINDSIVLEKDLFINAILINRSLKILALNHFLTFKYIRFEINDVDSCQIMDAVAKTSIEDFSISVFTNASSSFWHYDREKDLDCSTIEKRIEKFLISLDNFLSTSNKIRKLDLSLIQIPWKYINSFADLIIKHAKIGKINNFSGYNIKMLIDNKLDILELHKKQTYENDGIQVVLNEIFSRYLNTSDKIIKIVEKCNYKTTIDIKEFNENLIKNKKLILEPIIQKNSSSKITNNFFKILLSTKISQLIELDIRSFHSDLYLLVPEILKKIISLQILRFTVLKDTHFDCVYPKILNEVALYVKSIIKIECNLDNLYNTKSYEIFDHLPNNENLKEFKLKGLRILKNYTQDNILIELISRSKLISLNLTNIKILDDHFVLLAEGLEKNESITCLKIKGVIIEDEFKIDDRFKYNQAFYKILTKIQSKNYFEKISLYPFIKPAKMLYIEDLPDNIIFERKVDISIIESIKIILSNNKNLKKFNVFVAVTGNLIFMFSEILLESIKTLKNLKIINKIPIEKMFDHKQILDLAYNYFCEIGYLINETSSSRLDEEKSGLLVYMPIVISEIVKHSDHFHINSLLKKLFPKNVYEKGKTLNLTRIKRMYNVNCLIYLYNFIEAFTSLEELIISNKNMASIVMKIIGRNIKKLQHLHTIQLLIDSGLNCDLLDFLRAENLLYLKIVGGILKTYDIEKLSGIIKSSHLEKLALKNFDFQESDQIEIIFLLLLESIACPSLKSLKIHTKFTPDLFDLLTHRLNLFVNLELIDVNLLENYMSFDNAIKNIISIIKNKKTKLTKIKVHKYTWDIEKFQDKNKLEIIGCRLNPLDLMIFAEFCEQNIIKDVSYVDLSNNKDVVDENFVMGVVRIIEALGCTEFIVKKSGCVLKHKKEIKWLVKNKTASHMKFRI